MQSGASSKLVGPKAGASKKQSASQREQSSRVRNTSGDESGGGGGGGGRGRTLILCDGKNVTPKSLVPSLYQKDLRPEGGGPPGSAGEQGVGAGDRQLGDEGGGPGAALGAEDPFAAQVSLAVDKAKAKPAGLSREELERPVDIVLAETETVVLLSFPSLCVALDNPCSAQVSARNKAYDELCSSKADSDQYREQHAQTLNQPHKSKEVFAAPPSQESVEVNANGWDIYDTFATDPVPKHKQIQQACEKESAAAVGQAVKKPGCLFTMNEPYPSSEPAAQQPPKKAGGKDDSKRGLAGGKSGATRSGFVGNLGVSAPGVSSGASRMLGAGPTTGSLAAGPSGAVPASERELASTTPGPAGAEGAASPTDEAKDEDAGDKGGAASPMPGDPIPWKVGADSPIPEELAQGLRVMERIVSQNVFHKQHMIYRNYPTLEELARLDELRAEEAAAEASAAPALEASSSGRVGAAGYPAEAGDAGEADEGEAGDEASRDEGDSDKPSLQDLFCFDAPQLTQGMTVTCAEWNRHNQDLLAVSYGDTTPVPSTAGGLVLFWSLKNPTYPERVIRTRQGVTALHFSSVHPNMVAAGTHDGSVMIWDLRRPSDVPVLRSGSSVSTHNDQKHTDTVWETRWVDQGPDKQPPELLVSVSSDGQVLQWSMKKGLEQMPLMQLKRLPNPLLGSNAVYGHKEGIVFRKSSGFCIDFPRHDPATYLVGTEDGLVHQCSTSYNEQYLETYYGHWGPVYRVRCNPFESHAFLTCSADWTMRLWTTKPVPGHQPDTPLLTFQSINLTDAVNDVIWAPKNSTSFAAAMDDGRVELWDLSEKPLDPIVVHYPHAGSSQRRRTCVRFSPNSPVLVAGDDNGSVDVMRMYNTNQSYYSDQEQQDRLNAVMVKKR